MDVEGMLRQQVLFEGLSGEEMAELGRVLAPQRRKAGETIFEEGTQGDGMCVLCSGSVEVLKQGHLLATLQAPTVIGEMSLLTGGPRTATVVAKTGVELLALTREAFQGMLHRGGLGAYKVGMNLGRVLADRLKRVDEEWVRRLAEADRPGEFEAFRKHLLQEWSF